MNYLILSIITALFFNGSAPESFAAPASADDFPTFTPDEVARMPKCTFSNDDIISLMAGPDGKTWKVLKRGDDQTLKAVTEDGINNFKIQGIEDKRFVCPHFRLYKDGTWVFPVSLVHNWKTIKGEDEHGNPMDFSLSHTALLSTKLSEDELNDPFFQRLAYSKTLEDCQAFEPESREYKQFTLDHQLPTLARCMKERDDKEYVVNAINDLKAELEKSHTRTQEKKS